MPAFDGGGIAAAARGRCGIHGGGGRWIRVEREVDSVCGVGRWMLEWMKEEIPPMCWSGVVGQLSEVRHGRGAHGGMALFSKSSRIDDMELTFCAMS